MVSYKKLLFCAGAALIVATVGAADHDQNHEKKCKENKARHGVYVTGDALIFKAQQPGLEFATNVNTAAYDANLYTLNGQAISPCAKYDPGFRVGLGYVVPRHAHWDLYAYYTQFDTNAYRSVSAANGLAPVTNIEYASRYGWDTSKSAACWKLHFKTADLELARDFFVEDILHLRPHVGIRGAKISEDLAVTYTGITYGNSTPPFQFVGTDLRNTFWGAGVQCGLNTQWDMFKTCRAGNFSVYADASWALLTGKMKLCVNQTANINTQVAQTGNKFSALINAQTLALGFRWNKAFAHDRVDARVQIGWEQQFYANMWSFLPTDLSVYESLNNGDLGLSGWVVGARLDF